MSTDGPKNHRFVSLPCRYCSITTIIFNEWATNFSFPHNLLFNKRIYYSSVMAADTCLQLFILFYSFMSLPALIAGEGANRGFSFSFFQRTGKSLACPLPHQSTEVTISVSDVQCNKKHLIFIVCPSRYIGTGTCLFK